MGSYLIDNLVSQSVCGAVKVEADRSELLGRDELFGGGSFRAPVKPELGREVERTIVRNGKAQPRGGAVPNRVAQAS
jgi:hypothetical protein